VALWQACGVIGEIRDETGRFQKGTAPGPGRKPLPAWLTSTESSDALLRIQFDAATKGRIPLAPAGEDDEPEVTDDGEEVPPSRTQEVPPKVRLAAAEALLNRVHGKPAIVVERAETNPGASRLARLYRAADALEALEKTASAQKPDG
jgi:hypothetical protein